MAENKGIYKAILGVMEEVGAISKSKKNQQQGFMYRGIDDVMNALQPALIKHGVFVVPNILDQIREERQTKSGGSVTYSICTIKYTFYAEDGSYVESVVIGEGMDSGDKATNKSMAIAFKYACFQVFCIPTEEMKDPDAEVHELEPKVDKKKEELANIISQCCSEAQTKAKTNKDEVSELLKKYEPTGNPKKIKDIAKATELLRKLNEITEVK